jgi:hypothetical protein
MSKARVFYVLLDNFRNRTYISEDDKVLRMQHTSRTTASQKPRRASSVPALSISRLNKRLSTVTDSTAQTKSERLLPIIAIDNVSVSPEEYQRDEISTTEAMLRGYTSPRGNKFDLRIEDKENDPSCAGKPTRRRSVKIRAFAQKLKGLFGSEISNNSRREGSEEHSKPTTTPNRLHYFNDQLVIIRCVRFLPVPFLYRLLHFRPSRTQIHLNLDSKMLRHPTLLQLARKDNPLRHRLAFLFLQSQTNIDYHLRFNNQLVIHLPTSFLTRNPSHRLSPTIQPLIHRN